MVAIGMGSFIYARLSSLTSSNSLPGGIVSAVASLISGTNFFGDSVNTRPMISFSSETKLVPDNLSTVRLCCISWALCCPRREEYGVGARLSVVVGLSCGERFSGSANKDSLFRM